MLHGRQPLQMLTTSSLPGWSMMITGMSYIVVVARASGTGGSNSELAAKVVDRIHDQERSSGRW